MLTDWRGLSPPNYARDFHAAVAASLEGARAFNAKLAFGYERNDQSLIDEALADAQELSEQSSPDALLTKFRADARC
jgi:hypothetical protein